MGGQMSRNPFYDSLPPSSHRGQHKHARLPPTQCAGGGASPPARALLFHPHTKGSQIVMDASRRVAKRNGSFCNAITFTNRAVAPYEHVRLKITKRQSCWSGALRLGFTCRDPSRIDPAHLPKYACPDLVSQDGFWAKALPEEFADEGTVVAFWVDKKGRVFYRINDSAPMLFFSGPRPSHPLWALIDVYGLTRGVQLLDSELVPPDSLRPRSFTAVRSSSLRHEADASRLSVSLCDLNLQQPDGSPAPPQRRPRALPPSPSCPVPQNSLNSQQSSLLPVAMESDLHFHQLHGAHVTMLDQHTAARTEHAREERTLVFTHRPPRAGETVFVKVTKSSPARGGSLCYGVTSCDPAALRPCDLPYNPEALVDRKEFWAVCRVPMPLHSGDILGLGVNGDGELLLKHNGANVGLQVCVDDTRELWMFFSLHGAVTQLRILGSTHLGEPRASSNPGSPSSSPPAHSSSTLGSGVSDPVLSGGLGPSVRCEPTGGTGTPVRLPRSPTSPPTGRSPWADECSVCYENRVDTVIYACGHMCLCSRCGVRLKSTANACCPICRRLIRDIIKTYRST